MTRCCYFCSVDLSSIAACDTKNVETKSGFVTSEEKSTSTNLVATSEEEKDESEAAFKWTPTPRYDFDRPTYSSNYKGVDLTKLSPKLLIAISRDAAEKQNYALAIQCGY